MTFLCIFKIYYIYSLNHVKEQIIIENSFDLDSMKFGLNKLAPKIQYVNQKGMLSILVLILQKNLIKFTIFITSPNKKTKYFIW